jgi:hypothetical protein
MSFQRSFFSLFFSIESVVSGALPAGGNIQIDVQKERGAALILPKTPYRESLMDACRSEIERYFLRDHASWLTFAHRVLKQSDLKDRDLVFVYAVVKTSHWALASFSRNTISGKLNFTVGMPGAVQAVPGVWGCWKHVTGVWSLCGPDQDVQTARMRERATQAIADLDRSGSDPSGSGDVSAGSVRRLSLQNCPI